ncbi:MAG TPA: KH domain-containing protein [Chloroflexota bacterium]|nr:KH domain-containing protein [Chloroflexota bacterium]
MQALVEYMARGLVEQPDAVSVIAVGSPSSMLFELRVSPEDMGKIIGKEGRVAKAMRTLLKVAAAKEQTRANLEIVS